MGKNILTTISEEELRACLNAHIDKARPGIIALDAQDAKSLALAPTLVVSNATDH